jgi:MYXO-CTERM domain-containing protein
MGKSMHAGNRWSIPALCCLTSVAASSLAQADASDGERHPHRFSPAKKPDGVPSDFVLTRAGFMHPSCVITVRSDEITGKEGADLVVRGMDGTEHARLPACPYPRYRRNGQIIAAQDSTASHQPHTGKYDGWIASYYSYDSFDPGSTLTTDWYVPALPTKVADQDIAFFNAICTSADGGDILQPVLDFSEIPGKWAMESEHCCISGNDSQSTLVAVSPGDLIRGTIVPSNCNSAGLCTKWTITTLDVTTGKSTVNNATEIDGKPNLVNPAALESYGITSCDMFPANGELTFFNNTLTSTTGAKQSLKYSLDIIKTRDPGGSVLPLDCGYSGSSSGESYTLIWEKTHYPVGGPDAGAGGGTGGAAGTADGGANDVGGTGGTSGTGGRLGSGGTTGVGGMSGTGGKASGTGGASASSMGGSSGTGGTSASGGTLGLGGASATGGAVSQDGAVATSTGGAVSMGGTSGVGGGSGSNSPGGSSGQGDAGTGKANASNSGCSCSVDRTNAKGHGAGLLLFAVAVAPALLRRRRR